MRVLVRAWLLLALVFPVASGCAASYQGGLGVSVDSRRRVALELQAGAQSGVPHEDPGTSRAVWALLGLQGALGIDLGSGRLRGSLTYVPFGLSRHRDDRGDTLLTGVRFRLDDGFTIALALDYARDLVRASTIATGPCSDEGRERYQAVRVATSLDVGWGSRGGLLTASTGSGYAWTGYDHVHPFTECPEPPAVTARASRTRPR